MSRPAYERERYISQLEEALEHPLLCVHLCWDVYRRSGDMPSRLPDDPRQKQRAIADLVARGVGEEPELTQHVDDLYVLIDRRTGSRKLLRAEDADTDRGRAFLALRERSRQIELRYSVSEAQYLLVRDEEHRVVGAFGGERGGKTQAMALWVVRQWLLKGARHALGVWVAPSREQTQIAVRKIARGEDSLTALLPPSLITKAPGKHTETDQRIVFVDGFSLILTYADARKAGGNLKGIGPRFIAVDEACEVKPIKAWRVIRGRMNVRDGHKGQIFVASTPEPGHWAETEIVLPVDTGTRPSYTYGHLSCIDNPWMPLSEVQELIEDKGGPSDPVCRSEVFGLWVARGAHLWISWDAREMVRTFDGLKSLGLEDVSRGYCRHWPGVVSDVLCGQDFNMVPMTTIAARVGRREDGKHVVVITDEIRTSGVGSHEHGFTLHNAIDPVTDHPYGPLPIACDPSGATMHVGETSGRKVSRTDMLDLQAAGHSVRAAYYGTRSGKATAPPLKDSLNLCHRLMREGRLIVHSRCRELIRGLSTQEATPWGTKNIASKADDRLASATDAMRYLLVALFRDELFGSRKRQDEDEDLSAWAV